MFDTNDGILEETIAIAEDILGADFGRLNVDRIVVGIFFTGVKLTDGSTGSCATPLGDLETAMCCAPPSLVNRTSPRLAGQPARLLARAALGSPGLARAIGIATVNALAQASWNRRPDPAVELKPGVDAFDATLINPGERVVLVGAFVPFLKELKRRAQPYLVLERNPSLLKPEEMPYFRPAEDAASVLRDAEVVLITGSALVNNTLDSLLRVVPSSARVTVVGPTVGMLPGPLLKRGVDVLGCMRIKDPESFLDMLGEAAAPQQFLAGPAEKLALVRRSATTAPITASA
ncbi:MAG: DUF364 domain-containing protein [Alphaproteobacteria bacterium]|nr:DUF364 domain-containing protein [Alphaproteobacteria bacterium]